jgi:hypothetical protein
LRKENRRPTFTAESRTVVPFFVIAGREEVTVYRSPNRVSTATLSSTDCSDRAGDKKTRAREDKIHELSQAKISKAPVRSLHMSLAARERIDQHQIGSGIIQLHGSAPWLV